MLRPCPMRNAGTRIMELLRPLAQTDRAQAHRRAFFIFISLGGSTPNASELNNYLAATNTLARVLRSLGLERSARWKS